MAVWQSYHGAAAQCWPGSQGYERIAAVKIAAVVLVACGLAAQTAPAPDWTKVEGRTLRPADAESMGAVGILALGIAQAAKMTPEQQALYRAATQANGRRDFAAAFRLMSRFLLLMGGTPLSEATEFAAAFDVTLPRSIVTPGESFAVTLEPVFALPQAPAEAFTAKVAVRRRGGKARPLAPAALRSWEPVRLGVATAGLAPGAYDVLYQLLDPRGGEIAAATRPFVVVKDGTKRVEALQRFLDKEAVARRAAAGPWEPAAFEALEYLAAKLRKGRESYEADFLERGHPILLKGLRPFLPGVRQEPPASEVAAPLRDLDTAERLMRGIRSGRNPWPGLAGDRLLAYRSAVDQTLQPFRLFVPQPYDAARKYPLIVTLHGASGNESTQFDAYRDPRTGESVAKKLAQERGYILAAPNGRGPFGGYRGSSEKDVLDVLERVQSLYATELAFLTGHSMGAGGTWALGFKYPEKWAALAPIAGAMASPESLKAAPAMPVFFAQGARDTIANPAAARRLAEAARPVLRDFEYREYPEADHVNIMVAAPAAVFEFFDRVRDRVRKAKTP